MVRYYSCAKCGSSWQVVRDLQVERWPSHEVALLLETQSSGRVKLAAEAPSGEEVPRHMDSRWWDHVSTWVNRSSLTALGRRLLRSPRGMPQSSS
jgi:hypothetical protein